MYYNIVSVLCENRRNPASMPHRAGRELRVKGILYYG